MLIQYSRVSPWAWCFIQLLFNKVKPHALIIANSWCREWRQAFLALFYKGNNLMMALQSLEEDCSWTCSLKMASWVLELSGDDSQVPKVYYNSFNINSEFYHALNIGTTMISTFKKIIFRGLHYELISLSLLFKILCPELGDDWIVGRLCVCKYVESFTLPVC